MSNLDARSPLLNTEAFSASDVAASHKPIEGAFTSKAAEAQKQNTVLADVAKAKLEKPKLEPIPSEPLWPVPGTDLKTGYPGEVKPFLNYADQSIGAPPASNLEPIPDFQPTTGALKFTPTVKSPSLDIPGVTTPAEPKTGFFANMDEGTKKNLTMSGLVAGLTMMAGNKPSLLPQNALSGIGEGGLAGVKTYLAMDASDKKLAITQNEALRKALKDQAQVTHWKTLEGQGEATRNLAERRFSVDAGERAPGGSLYESRMAGTFQLVNTVDADGKPISQFVRKGANGTFAQPEKSVKIENLFDSDTGETVTMIMPQSAAMGQTFREAPKRVPVGTIKQVPTGANTYQDHEATGYNQDGSVKWNPIGKEATRQSAAGLDLRTFNRDLSLVKAQHDRAFSSIKAEAAILGKDDPEKLAGIRNANDPAALMRLLAGPGLDQGQKAALLKRLGSLQTWFNDQTDTLSAQTGTKSLDSFLKEQGMKDAKDKFGF
jgi:hypothetical protein